MEIPGSKHKFTYLGKGMMSIGCITNTIEWFKENLESLEALSKRKGYSNGQVLEYRNYIELAEQAHNQEK